MNESDSGRRPDEQDLVGTLLHVAGPRASVPEAVAHRVRTAVHDQWLQGVRARRRRRRTLLFALPATAALVLAVAVSLYRSPAGPSPGERSAQTRIVARLEAATGSGSGLSRQGSGRLVPLAVGEGVGAGGIVQTAADGRAALRTTSGVSVRLGGTTRLRLLSDVDMRLEHGTLYVDNPPSTGAGSAVGVRTPVGTIRDLGTQFEVQVEEAAMRVRVREGAVVLDRITRTDAAAAGVELRVGVDGLVERRSVPVHGESWAWAVGLAPPMAIEGRPLGEFLSWATREMGWRLEFQDDALARTSAVIVLHGTLTGLTPEEAVDSVLATCGLAHRVRDHTLIIQDPVREPRSP